VITIPQLSSFLFGERDGGTGRTGIIKYLFRGTKNVVIFYFVEKLVGS